MSLNYNPVLYSQDFKASLELGLQQIGSKLRPFVTTSTTKGAKQKVAIEREELVEATIVTGQIQPVVPINAAVTRRWVQPVSYDVTQIVDHFDELRMLNDPSSAKVQNAINALGREMDDQLKELAGETARATGEIAAARAQEVELGRGSALVQRAVRAGDPKTALLHDQRQPRTSQL